MIHGSCRFGLWRVEVDFEGNTVYRVSFQRTGSEGAVPVQFTKFLTGKGFDFKPLESVAVKEGELYYKIYRAVSSIPYGETRTYAEIAEVAGTHARVVGNAMSRNPTPLIVPCHRVVSKTGLGGFTPDIEIKKELLKIERTSRSISSE